MVVLSVVILSATPILHQQTDFDPSREIGLWICSILLAAIPTTLAVAALWAAWIDAGAERVQSESMAFKAVLTKVTDEYRRTAAVSKVDTDLRLELSPSEAAELGKRLEARFRCQFPEGFLESNPSLRHFAEQIWLQQQHP